MHFKQPFLILLICFPAIGCEEAPNLKQAPGSTASVNLIPEGTVQTNSLTSAELAEVESYMKRIIDAYNNADASVLRDLTHPGGDARGLQNTIDYNQGLMDGGDRVKSWAARRYTRPDWEYLKTSDFYPPPTVWIDIILSNDSGEYQIQSVLAPDSSGKLLRCYYVEKK